MERVLITEADSEEIRVPHGADEALSWHPQRDPLQEAESLACDVIDGVFDMIEGKYPDTAIRLGLTNEVDRHAAAVVAHVFKKEAGEAPVLVTAPTTVSLRYGDQLVSGQKRTELVFSAASMAVMADVLAVPVGGTLQDHFMYLRVKALETA